MTEIPLAEWQKQQAMREADRADDYVKLLERLRQIGRGSSNETIRRLAQRAYWAIIQLRSELADIEGANTYPEPPEDPALAADTDCCQ